MVIVAHAHAKRQPPVNFEEAITSCYRQYLGFGGRAVRSEYWYFLLFSVLVTGLSRTINHFAENLVASDMAYFRASAAAVRPGDTSVWDGMHVHAGSVLPSLLALSLCDAVIGLLALSVVLPLLAVQVRRLHDSGRPGWWVLWMNIAGFVLTGVLLLVLPGLRFWGVALANILPLLLLSPLMLQPSDPDYNKYDQY
jgi:uncharacterized membrane protein YhaH (DUF805 family)